MFWFFVDFPSVAILVLPALANPSSILSHFFFNLSSLLVLVGQIAILSILSPKLFFLSFIASDKILKKNLLKKFCGKVELKYKAILIQKN